MDGPSGDAASESLWRELDDLKRRVEVLESAIAASGVTRRAEAEPSTVVEYSAVMGSPASESRVAVLESRIGAQFFNRIGVFAVLAGVAWFLKLAIDRAWIGPELRVLLGLAVAIGLGVWSEQFRRGGAPAFSFTLKALGTGIAYLSLWAAFTLYHLLPGPAALTAMAAVTVTNAVLALRQDSELLAALALAGGLATPALLSTGASQEVFLFSYLLLLDAGALFLTAFRRWPRLAVGAFCGTTAYFGFWWVRFYEAGAASTTGIFVALFFAAFTAAPWLAFRRHPSRVETLRSRWLVALPIAVGTSTFLEAHGLLDSISASAWAPWVAVVLGAIYLALTVSAGCSPIQPIADEVGGHLAGVHLCLAVGFFALAAPLKFHNYGIALWWLAELLLIVAAAARFSRSRLAGALRGCAVVVLALSLFGLLFWTTSGGRGLGEPAFANLPFATSLAGLAVFAIAVAVGRRMAERGPVDGKRIALNSWMFLAGFAAVAFSVAALAAVSAQIDLLWHGQLRLSSGGVRFHRPVYLEFIYSAWFMVYGAGLMAVGFLRRSAFLRWQALLLLMLSIGKVFLFDVSHLSEGYRVASFLGLGVLLLAVSLAYQRDWLALRSGSRRPLSVSPPQPG
jgi:uncharacterized membrane protein